MEVILVGVVGVLIIYSFLCGVKVGQCVSKDEKVTINPIKSIKETFKSPKLSEAEELFNAEMENIDNYDGTSLGQKTLPR